MIRLASVCTLAFIPGAWRYSSTIPHFDEGSLAYYNYGDHLEIGSLPENPPEFEGFSTRIAWPARVSTPSCAAPASPSWPVTGATFSTPDSMLSNGLLPHRPQLELLGFTRPMDFSHPPFHASQPRSKP